FFLKGYRGVCPTGECAPELRSVINRPGMDKVVWHNHPNNSSLSPHDMGACLGKSHDGVKAFGADPDGNFTIHSFEVLDRNILKPDERDVDEFFNWILEHGSYLADLNERLEHLHEYGPALMRQLMIDDTGVRPGSRALRRYW